MMSEDMEIWLNRYVFEEHIVVLSGERFEVNLHWSFKMDI